ncbi:class I SAM-dependent DNA methyltransferase [Thalassobaculum sp.]|uniref:class I SAM-dependent DNA methyltransferase n=1 Tax=Thalassobaculum sp. TaxID=2022740 RepID=UPI003B5A74DC
MTDYDKILRSDGQVSMDGSTNAVTYDAWASDYDRELAAWGYEAPDRAAAFLAKHLDDTAAARVLDCGCGTGMTGVALREAGFAGPLVGFDMSQASLDVAREKGIYADLQPVDLNGPLPLEAQSIDGILCVGVLTYVDQGPLLREWMRVLRPGGVAVFTCRQDFWDSRDFEGSLGALEAEGSLTRLEVTGPMPYIPGNPDFGTKIQIRYGIVAAR